MMTSVDTPHAGSADPRAYARILWRWKFLLIALVVLIPVAVYVYESSRPKVYQASVLAEVTGGQQLGAAALLNQAPSGPDVTDLQADARLITTAGVAQQAARYLHPAPASFRSLLGVVNATSDSTTNFITISAKASEPRRAAAIANAFASAIAKNQTHAAAQDVNAAIAQLQTERRSVTPGTVTAAQLSGQIVRYRALQAAQGADIATVDPAVAPATPVAPRVRRSVILALIVALLLGLGAVALAEVGDRRLRDPDELGDAAGLPLLSAIPKRLFTSRGLKDDVDESFVTLRSALTYFNVDRPICSVLLTSPGKEDGKTTVATNLARALARSGKDVILIDADMRRPAVAERLGIPAQAGLAEVLIGALPVDRAMWEEPARLSNGGGGRLRVLPVGPVPPNPSELLGSQRMKDLLSELGESCDMVLIDSTPLLSVSDSMPLLGSVSGVVLVGRVNRTSREAIARLRFVVDTAGGHALGVVATGAKRGGLYVASGYGYEADYAVEGDVDHSRGPLFPLPRRGRAAGEKVGPSESG
jgi:capsular exopolysaccharide synthesis family protein